MITQDKKKTMNCFGVKKKGLRKLGFNNSISRLNCFNLNTDVLN